MEYKKALNISAPFSADEEKPFIFISYAHADRELVFPIIKTYIKKVGMYGMTKDLRSGTIITRHYKTI